MMEVAMDADQDKTGRWVEAALAMLAEGGIDCVRVEMVAERLGVTKGGFYRRFKDRRALLDAVLENWSKGRIAAVAKQTALGDMKPAERLRSVIKLNTERLSAQGLSIELAIRQWARNDKAAAAVVAGVDAYRLNNVQKLYEKTGLAPPDARARAVLLYSFLFGQDLLFLKKSARERDQLIASCTAFLTE
jgi:AcrR family transcriptional regulator